MPKFDVNKDFAVAKAWATGHVVAAFAIGVALGFVIKLLL